MIHEDSFTGRYNIINGIKRIRTIRLLTLFASQTVNDSVNFGLLVKDSLASFG